jgi:hypothetical protein
VKKHPTGLRNTNDNEPPLGFVQELTEAEAARELRISIDLLQSERAAGKIAFARAGRRVFYPVSCIEQYRRERVTRACPSRTTSDFKGMGQPATGTWRGAKDAARRAAQWARRTKP